MSSGASVSSIPCPADSHGDTWSVCGFRRLGVGCPWLSCGAARISSELPAWPVRQLCCQGGGFQEARALSGCTRVLAGATPESMPSASSKRQAQGPRLSHCHVWLARTHNSAGWGCVVQQRLHGHSVHLIWDLLRFWDCYKQKLSSELLQMLLAGNFPKKIRRMYFQQADNTLLCSCVFPGCGAGPGTTEHELQGSECSRNPFCSNRLTEQLSAYFILYQTWISTKRISIAGKSKKKFFLHAFSQAGLTMDQLNSRSQP